MTTRLLVRWHRWRGCVRLLGAVHLKFKPGQQPDTFEPASQNLVDVTLLENLQQPQARRRDTRGD